MEEPWAVNPLVPVRLRPVTPKRMPFNASRTRAAENRALTPDGQGSSPWRRTTEPLVAESADAPVSETGAAGHVHSTRTEGTSQQSGSSAAEQRPHKAKAGGSCRPRTTIGISKTKTINQQGGVP